MPKGIDCANPLNARTARTLAQAGYSFAGRYLVPTAYAWKRLTRTEAEVITAAGMKIISVFETAVNRPQGGASAGRADGSAAFKQARLVGQPEGSAIYFAVDYDAQPSDYDRIEAYLRAAAVQIPGYRIGVYGSYAVIEEMAARGACDHFWQTLGWSRRKRSDRNNIYQYEIDTKVSGIAVDLNDSYGGEGWWSTSVTPSEPGGGEEEEEPTMSKEDALKIIAFLQAGYNATSSKEARDEFHRLADEVRKAAGLPLDK